MRLLTRMMIAVCMLAPTVSQAALVWSGCETITAVSNYLAYAAYNAVYLSISPAISGCIGNTGGNGSAVALAVGQEGVTSTNIDSLLAVALAAYSSAHHVKVYYDNATNQCYAQIVAVGGYYGECP
jgi:hypothetical protein